MNDFHGRIMNIRDGADGAASIEYKRGHRDARHAAAEIANEADNRIVELEAQIAARDASIAEVEDYRLALRLMIRTAINAEAAEAARGNDD